MRLTERAHLYLSQQLKRGDCAIDATAGNGYDCAKMATLVGQSGQLIAIDIQEAAITATRERLQSAAQLDQCQLLHADHASALHALIPQYAQRISAITFNLGYLPGSDKRIQTHAPSTLKALHAASQLLNYDGLLLVTAYRGHAGGLSEAVRVAAWMQRLKARGWSVQSHEPVVSGTRIPPILWVARKQSITPQANQNRPA